jgi:hypothetical protein
LKASVISKVCTFLIRHTSDFWDLLAAEEEETLLHNEDRISHRGGGSTTANMIKKEVLSIFDVLWKPEYNRAVIAVIAVMLAQQLCGMPKS